MKRSVVIILFLMCLIPSNILAIENIEIGGNISDDEVISCKYSKEYLQWLTFSDEEKQGLEEPSICEVHEEVKTYKQAESIIYSDRDTYPSSYNSFEQGYVTSVKNQMQTGTCWAFGANSSVEAYLLKKHGLTVDLSERHIEYSTTKTFLNGVINPEGHGRVVDQGGNVYLSAAYYYRGAGPIDEKEMPFENNTNILDISAIQGKTTIVDVDDIFMGFYSSCTDTSKNVIKSLITEYGAVSASVYMTNDEGFYNKTTNALYHSTATGTNHRISIVGWDDNYSKDNFASSNKPAGNGAWIIKNSWGEDWGNDGFFYVSYYDTRICTKIGAVRSANMDVPDNNYYHDPQGMSASIGFANSAGSWIYAANVFKKGSEPELLTEVMAASLATTDIEVYVIDDARELSLDNAVKVGSSKISYGGYTSVVLEEPIKLDSEQFTIIVGYKSSSNSPIGASQYSSGNWSTVVSDAGESFTSSDGVTFTDLKAGSTVRIATIKAETDDILYSIDEINYSDNYINTREGGEITFDISTTAIDDNEDVVVTIKDSRGKDKTNLFSLDVSKVVDNKAQVKLIVPTNEVIDFGLYTINVRYKYMDMERTFNLYQYKNLELTSYTYADKLFNNVQNEMLFNLVATNYLDDTTINVAITDENHNDVTDNFVINMGALKDQNLQVSIKNKVSHLPGSYNVTFSVDKYQSSHQITIIDYIPIAQILMSKDSIIIGDKKSDSLSFELLPVTVTDDEVVWESDNDNVVTVDQNGNLLQKSRGNAIIKVYAKSNPSVYAETRVTSVISDIKVENKVVIGNYSGKANNIYDVYGGNVTGMINAIDITDLKLNVNNSNGEEMTNLFDVKVGDQTNLNIQVYENTPADIYCVNAVASYVYNDTVISQSSDDNFCFEVREATLTEKIEASDIVIEEFDKEVIKYTVNPSDITNNSVSYSSSNEEVVTINSSGEILARAVGKAFVTIKAEDGSGVSKKVEVKVVDSILENTGYVLNNGKIANVVAETDYNSFVNNLNVQDDVQLKMTNGNIVINSGYVATGNQFTKIKNGLSKNYLIVVNGDVSKDGLVRSNDALLIERHLVKLLALDENQLIAGNVSRDYNLASNDALIIKRYLVGLNKI